MRKGERKMGLLIVALQSPDCTQCLGNGHSEKKKTEARKPQGCRPSRGVQGAVKNTVTEAPSESRHHHRGVLGCLWLCLPSASLTSEDTLREKHLKS